jgi:hypothetical protein
MSASQPVMSFPTRKGAVVEVTATGNNLYPYRFECSGSKKHRSLGYSALPYARDDAKAHADVCRKRGAK